jgi:hypothetical protein
VVEELVAAEDVLLFVNAAITSTGQREFRSSDAEQGLSLRFLHEYVLGNYRELYAAALALDVNDHNAALIIRNLLLASAEVGAEERRREGRLIARRLETLPPRENSPPGLAGEVLRVWRTRLDPEHTCAVVHLNPVYDADDFDVRRLAPTVPTAGIREAENLPALVELAGFAEGRTGLAELRAHLDRRVADFLKEKA